MVKTTIRLSDIRCEERLGGLLKATGGSRPDSFDAVLRNVENQRYVEPLRRSSDHVANLSVRIPLVS